MQGNSDGLARDILDRGPPDIVWVSGHHAPPNMAQVFDLCRSSLKIVYSKNWTPWEVEQLERYDLCLVDEERQIGRVRQAAPNVPAAVWDKLIDYEGAHYPIECEKTYDLCYVAYLRPRKEHELLFEAMAKLKDRQLTCVCVGGDREGRMAQLERLAADLGCSVEFTGNVSAETVNTLMNRSRIGVMCAERDSAPRVILEYMAANVPVLVTSKLLAGTRYVGPQAGLVRAPEEFHLGIAKILDNRDSYTPRAFFLEHYSRDKVVAKFLAILEEAGFSLPVPASR